MDIEEVKTTNAIKDTIPATFKRLKEYAIKTLNNKKTMKFEVGDLLPVIVELMKELKMYHTLKGPEKREVILEILTETIQEISPDTYKQIQPIVEDIVPKAIDLFFELNQTDSGLFKSITKNNNSTIRRLLCCFRQMLR